MVFSPLCIGGACFIRCGAFFINICGAFFINICGAFFINTYAVLSSLYAVLSSLHAVVSLLYAVLSDSQLSGLSVMLSCDFVLLEFDLL